MCTNTGIILFLHRNHLIPGLSSSLHSLPLAVLPNRFPPSDSTAHFPHFFPWLLQHTSVYTLWCADLGTGLPLFTAPCQVPAPNHTVPSWSSSLSAKAEKFPCQGSLCCKYILPEQKVRLHQLPVKACSAVICRESHSSITNNKETAWMLCLFCSHLWVQPHTEPIIPCSVLTH